MTLNPHCNMGEPGLSKMPHNVELFMSRIPGTIHRYSNLQVSTRLLLRGTQHLRLIFREEVGVSVVSWVNRGAHIQLDLQGATECYLLNEPYLWLTRTDRRTITGSRMSRIVI